MLADILEDRTLPTAYLVDTLSDTGGADGRLSLREAIEAANTNSAGIETSAGRGGLIVDTIAFHPSLAGGTIRLAGAELAISGNLSITGLGASRLTISGNNTSRVFNVAANVAAEIRGLTITGGRVDGTGGGILNNGAVTVADCVVRGNYVARSGGTQGFGGGIFSVGPLSLVNSTVSGNTAEGQGGGLWVFDGEIDRCAITGNTGGSGVQANGDGGGGIFILGSSQGFLLSNSTVADNTARGFGGGIESDADQLESITIVNCTISGNRADFAGGGMCALGEATPLMRDVTVFGNRADADGDGFGGAGGLAGRYRLYNTIVAGNTRGTGTPSDGAAATAESLNNLIGVAGAGAPVNGQNGNIVGVDWRIVLDPVLRNNGGATLTHRLLIGGPAIDAGNSSFLFWPDRRGLTTDQRGAGFARVLGRNVDIGAFESAPATDLVGFLNGGWWVGASTGTSFNTTSWAAWSNVAWDSLGQADFDNDGRADVFGLLDGSWWVGLSTGTSFAAATRWTVWSNLGWLDVRAADLNADGRADILARVGGNWWASLSTGTSFAAPSRWVMWSDAAWQFVTLADFNGDRRADLAGYLSGNWWVSTSTGTTFNAATRWATWSALPWQAAGAFDADGDGLKDLWGFYRGQWRVDLSTGTAFVATARARWSDADWRDAVVGDFDGDGRDDVGARLAGNWWVALSNAMGGANPVALWGAWSEGAWQDVRVGDFDGDGRDDIAGRLNGQWWVARSSTGSGFVTTLWGGWSDAAWGAVGAVDATGHVVTAPGGGAAGAFAASTSPSRAAAFAPIRAADDRPAVLFWSKARDDAEFAAGLLAG